MYYLVAVLIVLLTLAVYYSIKFAIILIEMQEAIEDSLDVIDEKYNKISKILEIPVFYESNEIKLVLQNLQDTRNSLLYVANRLSSINVEEDDIDFYEHKEEEKE